MTVIALTNQNFDSPEPKVNIDLLTKQCTLADGRQVPYSKLLKEVRFLHPLFDERVLTPHQRVCHYEYHSLDELFLSGSYVYATLLKLDNPSAYQFKISPSLAFKTLDNEGEIYFSPYAHQKAKKTIQISQLNALIQRYGHREFKFFQGLHMDVELNVSNLPHFVHGDMLYRKNLKILSSMHPMISFDRFELRYLGESMGFGLFSRDTFQKGEILFNYAATKAYVLDNTNRYAFIHYMDCFGMMSDAKCWGNLARFVNHAPKFRPNEPHLLHANLRAITRQHQGMDVVIFQVKKNIEKGEQFLVDYGKHYFTTREAVRFKANGRMSILQLKDKYYLKRNTLSLMQHMARSGIKDAQVYLMVRLCLIILMIGIGIVSLHYFF